MAFFLPVSIIIITVNYNIYNYGYKYRRKRKKKYKLLNQISNHILQKKKIEVPKRKKIEVRKKKFKVNEVLLQRPILLLNPVLCVLLLRPTIDLLRILLLLLTILLRVLLLLLTMTSYVVAAGTLEGIRGMIRNNNVCTYCSIVTHDTIRNNNIDVRDDTACDGGISHNGVDTIELLTIEVPKKNRVLLLVGPTTEVPKKKKNRLLLQNTIEVKKKN